MSLTITQIKTAVEPKMRGATLKSLVNFYGKCEEAAGQVLRRCHPPETIRRVRIENAIYSHVYNYTINQDVKGIKGVLDIRPIGERDNNDDIAGRYGREFDIRKDRDTYTIEVINGVKTLRLSKRVNGHTVLAEMDSLTQGATITGSGDVQNLTTNTLDYIAGSASVQFGLSGATGSGTISIALTNSIDLSTIEDIGALFFWMRFQNTSLLTNVELRWGSDSSNYWSQTITAPHDRTAWENGAWTLQRGDWDDATETGTPDSSAVDYLALVFTYTSGTPIANNRLDNITVAKGKAYESLYYSDRFFKDTSGNYLQRPTADSDTINIAVDGHNLFMYELMRIIIQEHGQKSVAQSDGWFKNQLGITDGGAILEGGLYDSYNSDHPHQGIPKQSTYYDFGYYSPPDEYGN